MGSFCQKKRELEDEKAVHRTAPIHVEKIATYTFSKKIKDTAFGRELQKKKETLLAKLEQYSHGEV